MLLVSFVKLVALYFVSMVLNFIETTSSADKTRVYHPSNSLSRAIFKFAGFDFCNRPTGSLTHYVDILFSTSCLCQRVGIITTPLMCVKLYATDFANCFFFSLLLTTVSTPEFHSLYIIINANEILKIFTTFTPQPASISGSHGRPPPYTP